MENNICKFCGKKKEEKLMPYINKILYIDCQCEIDYKNKIIAEKNEKARQIYINRRIKASGVLLKEQNAFFDNLIVDEYNRKAVDAGKFIVLSQLAGDTSQNKNGLILSGNRGSGKTYIATCIINEYNKNARLNKWVVEDIIKGIDNAYADDLRVRIDSDCRFIKEKDVINLSEKYNYKDNTSLIDEYKKAKILVVDDIGSSYGDSKKTMSILFDLIDYRFSQQLSTIVTTNLSKEELQIYLGERSFDRLINSCYYIKLTSPESRRG